MALNSESELSAVLVALMPSGNGEINVLLTRRNSKLRHHSGEVAFPGGRNEKGEGDVEAALREAQEEIGLDPARVSIISELERLAQPVIKPPLAVTPVVAIVEYDTFERLQPSPAEVESIFSVPLWRFLLAGNGYSYNEFPPKGKSRYRAHHFEWKDEGVSYDVWGQTADILIQLAEVVYVRKPAFQRTVDASGSKL